jgi:hypothetical protein
MSELYQVVFALAVVAGVLKGLRAWLEEYRVWPGRGRLVGARAVRAGGPRPQPADRGGSGETPAPGRRPDRAAMPGPGSGGGPAGRGHERGRPSRPRPRPSSTALIASATVRNGA